MFSQFSVSVVSTASSLLARNERVEVVILVLPLSQWKTKLPTRIQFCICQELPCVLRGSSRVNKVAAPVGLPAWARWEEGCALSRMPSSWL